MELINNNIKQSEIDLSFQSIQNEHNINLIIQYLYDNKMYIIDNVNNVLNKLTSIYYNENINYLIKLIFNLNILMVYINNKVTCVESIIMNIKTIIVVLIELYESLSSNIIFEPCIKKGSTISLSLSLFYKNQTLIYFNDLYIIFKKIHDYIKNLYYIAV